MPHDREARSPRPSRAPVPDPAVVRIGERIRGLREAGGISMSELARRSRLGKGTLSELERGRRNPTLDTLFAIATALGASLGELLSDAPGRTSPERPEVHGDSVDARLLDRWDDEGVTEVYDVRLRPHLQESRPHLTGVTETLTVVTGRAEAGPQGSPEVLLPGESLTFPGDRPHSYRGIGGSATGILIMRYPPQGADGDR